MFSLSFLIIFLVRSKSVRNRLDRYENCPLAANSKRQGSQLHIRGKHLHLYPSFASTPGVKVFMSFPLTRRLLNKRTKHLTPVLGVLLSYLVLSKAVCIFLSLSLLSVSLSFWFLPSLFAIFEAFRFTVASLMVDNNFHLCQYVSKLLIGPFVVRSFSILSPKK